MAFMKLVNLARSTLEFDMCMHFHVFLSIFRSSICASFASQVLENLFFSAFACATYVQAHTYSINRSFGAEIVQAGCDVALERRGKCGSWVVQCSGNTSVRSLSMSHFSSSTTPE